MSSTVAAILRRAVDGHRLGFDDGVELFRSASLLDLGRAADAVCRRLHPEPYRTYNIDRNINYTNVCAAVCDFCAFYRPVGDTEAYVLDRDVLLEKIRETINGVGDFHFSSLREFLDSGPYTARQAVLGHLRSIRSYPAVYGGSGAHQMYEQHWR